MTTTHESEHFFSDPTTGPNNNIDITVVIPDKLKPLPQNCKYKFEIYHFDIIKANLGHLDQSIPLIQGQEPDKIYVECKEVSNPIRFVGLNEPHNIIGIIDLKDSKVRRNYTIKYEPHVLNQNNLNNNNQFNIRIVDQNNSLVNFVDVTRYNLSLKITYEPDDDEQH